MTGSGLIDFQQLHELTNGDTRLERQAFCSFLPETESFKKALGRDLEEKNQEAARRLSHAIKGAADSLGVHSVADIAKEVHDAAVEGNMHGARESYRKLVDEFDRVRQFLEEYYGL